MLTGYANISLEPTQTYGQRHLHLLPSGFLGHFLNLSPPSLPFHAGITFLNQSYDPFSNQMTAYIQFAQGTYPKVQNLLVLNFQNTRREMNNTNGTGFTDLRVIRPGYIGREDQLFTDNCMYRPVWSVFNVADRTISPSTFFQGLLSTLLLTTFALWVSLIEKNSF